jgi:hypothetical protein
MTRTDGPGGLLSRVRSLLATLTLLLVVGLLAGCGSKSSNNTETTSPVAAATAWAGGVCLAFTTWKQDLVDASNSLKANPNQTQLYESVTAAKTATTDLKNTITGIGKPPVADSKTAQTALDSLRAQLTTSVNTIQSSIDGVSSVTEAAAVVPSVKTELQKMQTELKNAGSTLKELPSGTLHDGFAAAPNCQSLGS